MIINMNGAKAPETPSPTLQEKTVTPQTLPTVIGADEGYTGLSQVTVNPDAQLIPTNIRSGKTIFGVDGSFVGEPQFTDDIDITAIGGVAVSYPIFVPVIGTFRLAEDGRITGWSGVSMTLTSDKPPMGSPSVDWSENYCFSYPTNSTYYVITQFNGMGNLSTYIGDYAYAPVEIDIPEGNYPADMGKVTPWLRNATIELINANMSYGFMVSNSETVTSNTPTNTLYATNDSFEIPNQTITVTNGLGMVHLPAIHTTGYVQSYNAGDYYVVVSVNIYGTMKVVIS